ncbi:MAG: formamidopyrimidine-DNA glycosylase [Desulfobulbus propionicus]|nr:MAG: formamidopyrimidine-DNA glycosylase [Desulfobulbus propionicus]
MPELPEVEVTRLGLLQQLTGGTVCDVWWSGKRLRTEIKTAVLKNSLCTQQLVTIDRRAKYLLFRFSQKAVLVIHLGMTGKLSLVSFTRPRDKHDHLGLTLSNGMELRFNDCRRFGSIILWPHDTAEKQEYLLSQHEGIEPFSREFNGPALQHLARKRTAAVKTFLMNGRIIAGIGNIYANEILFAARVHPAQPAGTLVLEQWQQIADVSRNILQKAIAAGGTTIADFLGANGNPGYFQLQLSVYGKKGQPCPLCSTPITRTVLGGRATFLCSSCQQQRH